MVRCGYRLPDLHRVQGVDNLSPSHRLKVTPRDTLTPPRPPLPHLVRPRAIKHILINLNRDRHNIRINIRTTPMLNTCLSHSIRT